MNKRTGGDDYTLSKLLKHVIGLQQQKQEQSHYYNNRQQQQEEWSHNLSSAMDEEIIETVYDDDEEESSSATTKAAYNNLNEIDSFSTITHYDDKCSAMKNNKNKRSFLSSSSSNIPSMFRTTTKWGSRRWIGMGNEQQQWVLPFRCYYHHRRSFQTTTLRRRPPPRGKMVPVIVATITTNTRTKANIRTNDFDFKVRYYVVVTCQQCYWMACSYWLVGFCSFSSDYY